ncbi:MAG: hypothetical protein QF760_03450, partial [Candidatus Thalassarchaeaceae archaeon]|nr:hypothetical protein [Candidatus Thalassarchaeaceae archaeon]
MKHVVLVPGDEPVSSGNEGFRHEDSPIQWVPYQPRVVARGPPHTPFNYWWSLGGPTDCIS